MSSAKIPKASPCRCPLNPCPSPTKATPNRNKIAKKLHSRSLSMAPEKAARLFDFDPLQLIGFSKTKKNRRKRLGFRRLSLRLSPDKIKRGIVLLSHKAAPAVPSPMRGLTSEFGMGSGVSLALWTPQTLYTVPISEICRIRMIENLVMIMGFR